MENKTCIWCCSGNSKVSFNKEAHTIPLSIGGEDICLNVCDDCNHYFGSPHDKKPAIETVFKETFNITRARLLDLSKDIGKNKTLPFVKSIYFDVNFEKRIIKIKPQFKFKSAFQNMLCRQFKRGLFKVFLEETERQNKNGFDSKFDFIREFARYNLGEHPVFYFRRKYGAILLAKEEAKHPKFYFNNQMKFHLKEDNFFEFEFLGHLFSIPTSRNYIIMIDNYLKKTTELKKEYFYSPIQLKYLTEIDLLLEIMNQ